MYLSKLILNPSPVARRVLKDLAAPYEMHRTLMRAFPDRADGGPGRVLFRVEPVEPGQAPVVLVQSHDEPAWSELRAALPDQPQDVPYLLTDPKPKPLGAEFFNALTPGRRLRFRLRANATVKRDGKRHALLQESDQMQWLQRKGRQHGFEVHNVRATRQATLTSPPKGSGNSRQIHHAVDFEGILEVTDPNALAEAVRNGIGPAKAYGFGMLSLAAHSIELTS